MGTAMEGKQVVITGATAGIGQAAAIELARRGAAISLVARNPARAEATARKIAEEAPNAPAARTFIGDLADLRSIRTVAGEVATGLERIDVLVNNAGIAAVQQRLTVDGFDEMLAANYLGPFLLTHLLLDTMQASAPSRIVIVGSEAHRTTGKLDPERFEAIEPYRGLQAQLAYGRTKLLDLLWADELARRLDPSAVTVNSLCPGMVATELVREVGVASGPARLLAATPLVNTPEQGARMTVRLASDPTLSGTTGRFFSSTPGAGLLPTVRARRDPSVARRVYERTLSLVGAHG